MLSQLRFIFTATCAVTLLGFSVATACPVPVYQYSIEHWEPDPYRIVVHICGQPSADEQAALQRLLNVAQQGDPVPANIEVTVETAADASNCRMEVFFPAIAPIKTAIWEGELTADNVEALLSSPARTTIAEALAERTSAVWIMLESGDRNADRQLERMLEQTLNRIARETVIAESADWGGETVALDSNVNFRLVRISPDDPAEQMLVRMLLATEPDLASDFSGQPMVFPIYGRGIILYALVGRGINEWTIGSAAEFLTGPCSCQIKAANPGTDMLVSADWDARIVPMTPAAVGGATGTGGFLRALDENDDQ